MWVKIDDGMATHPKYVADGPLAFALQLRSICYANHHLTDGHLPVASLPYLLVGMPEGCDWPALMTTYRLWDPRDGDYVVHDFLDWNLSKLEVEMMRKAQS